MTNLQRRLIVLTLVLTWLLGPILIMGNCSGWNEGSMKVASCAVDFRLARDLADLLYGIVLISAFFLGIPILVYLGACVVLTVLVNRLLRKRYPPEVHRGHPAYHSFPRALFLGAMVLLAVMVVAIVLWFAGAVANAVVSGNTAFDEHCRTAGEGRPIGPRRGDYGWKPADFHRRMRVERVKGIEPSS